MPAAPQTSQPQTALHHLQELRTRLIYCVGVMLVGGALAYLWRSSIIALLQQPLHRQLFYTSPTGSFQFVMQVCLLGGFLLALPVICYHLLRFLEPALPRRFSRRLMTALILCSLALAAGGVAFAYYLSLPAALRFFNTVGTSSLHPLITIDQYFSFVLGYLGTFALVFQLPLVLLLINHITPLGPGGLSKWRRHVIIGAFALALIMPSAPDPLSQVMLALPIIVLYEVSIWLVRLANRRRAVQPQARAQAPTVMPVVAATPRPPALRPLRPTGNSSVIDLRSATVSEPRPVPAVNVLDLRPRSS